MKLPVSVIVMTKNEELNIKQCLDSLTGFEEVFVVDSGSADDTVTIAGEMGAKVVDFRWNGKYPKKKQWCLENLSFSYEWVLYVDADERVTSQITHEISDVLKKPKHDGYFVCYDYVFLGRVLKYGHKIHKLIFFKRKAGRFIDYDDLEVQNMWEVEGHYQPEISGSVGRLQSKMVHNDYEELYSFFEKINRYSDWEAHLRSKNSLRHKKQSSIRSRRYLQWVSDRMPLRWVAMFFYSYIIKLGFLDGLEGFYYSIALTVYYIMTSMKIREILKNE